MFLEFYFAYMVLFPGLKSKKVFCRGPVCEQWVHQNGHINSYSVSNLRRLPWIMYHHVLHDSKGSAQSWCRIQVFAMVFITTVTQKQPYQLLFRLKLAPSAFNHLKGSFTIFLFSVRTHILDSNEVWYSWFWSEGSINALKPKFLARYEVLAARYEVPAGAIRGPSLRGDLVSRRLAWGQNKNPKIWVLGHL